jgi:ABC-type nitrate/sulfonate/bicarbonate transport system substrate-binding protein
MGKKVKLVLFFSLITVMVFITGTYRIFAGEEVTLLLDWVPNTNHTGLYIALDKGWYQDEGLKVNIIQPSGNMSVEQVVGAAKADFGISFQEWVTSARVEGVPIVSLAAVIQHNTTGFAAVAGQGIKSPADFTGKSYGGWGLPIEKEILKSLINGDGGDYQKLKFINIVKGDLLTMLDQRKFDLAWIYNGWDGIQAEMRSMELNIVMMKDYQQFVPDYYTPVIISSQKLIKEKPDVIRRFMKATARGYNYAINNPGAAAEILLKYTPESDPELIRKSQNWLSARYQDDALYWGMQKPEVWQDFGDWMFKKGLIQKGFRAESAFTNEFLPEVD